MIPVCKGRERPSVGKVRAWIEFVALYVALPPILLAVRTATNGSMPVLPVLWVAALSAACVLRVKYGWGRTAFVGAGRRSDWRMIAVRIGWVGSALAVGLLAVAPTHLLELPRHNLRLWGLVMVCYPLLSVYPQGILYRGLFYERYAHLFGTERGAWWGGAVVFAWMHVVFANAWAMILTFVGALLFNRTYRRSGSLLASGIEHAAYGQLAFTLGWGRFLYHGTVRLLEMSSR